MTDTADSLADRRPPGEKPSPSWRPLPATERRVLGVLAEKAKTTPEQYPLSLNALKAGCNQKSNRAPLMQLDDDDIEEALRTLRHAGAAMEVQEGGRVSRYRHCLYEWLGVDKVGLAVMAELLLRGPQTIGELRGRAARMEPIADVGALRPHLETLVASGLALYLTPPGRGCIVSHALYPSEELEALQALHGPCEHQPSAAAASGPSPSVLPASPPPADPDDPRSALAAVRGELDVLRSELGELRGEWQASLGGLRRSLDELRARLGDDVE